MSINLLALVGAMLTIATPLVWAGIGELIVERGGVLNLGIEGTMYLGAFVGFLAALRSGSVWVGSGRHRVRRRRRGADGAVRGHAGAQPARLRTRAQSAADRHLRVHVPAPLRR